MTRFTRRTYLKIGAASAFAGTGMAGIAQSVDVSDVASSAAPPGLSSGRVSQPGLARGRECPAGTVLLAKYETDGEDDGEEDQEETNGNNGGGNGNGNSGENDNDEENNDDGDNEEDEFTLTEGEDVITFSDIQRNDEGEIVAFSWESTAAVALLAVKFGPTSEAFEGGFNGEVDLSNEQNAIGHVTFCTPRGGRAVLCELDMETGVNAYDTEFHLTDDPPVSVSREAIAQEKFGKDFDELSKETTLQVQAIFNRQPFPPSTDVADIRTREEIAEDEFDEFTEDDDESDLADILTRSQLVALENVYDRQFGPLPSESAAKFSLNQNAQARSGFDFDALSEETTLQVQAIFNRQPFPAGTTPRDIRTREEIAEDEFDEFSTSDDESDLTEILSHDQLVTLQNLYDKQFGSLPSEAESRDAVHITSDSTATMDYAHGIVNVLQQLDEQIALEDLDDVRFDFFEGSENTGASPDEVFVAVLTPEDELKLAVRTVNDASSGQSWRTFDVLSSIRGSQWSVEDIVLDDLRTSTGAIGTAGELRDTPDENVVLADEFGDATLVGVGFGAGNTRKTTTIDRYFDRLVVEWDSNSQSFDFPAVLPVNVDSVEERGNTLVVTLSFQQSEAGISFDDVAEKTVKLNQFGRFAPPIEPGVMARSVTVQNGTLEARFLTSRVDDLLEDDVFIVSGDFDVSSGSAFFGVGTRD